MKRIGRVAAGTAVLLLTSLGIASGQDRAPSATQPTPQGGMMGPGSGMPMMGGAAMNAPDRLDRMEKMMSAMLEAVKGTKAALTPLYAVFTEEQKKLADQLIRGPMGMGPM